MAMLLLPVFQLEPARAPTAILFDPTSETAFIAVSAPAPYPSNTLFDPVWTPALIQIPSCSILRLYCSIQRLCRPDGRVVIAETADGCSRSDPRVIAANDVIESHPPHRGILAAGLASEERRRTDGGVVAAARGWHKAPRTPQRCFVLGSGCNRAQTPDGGVFDAHYVGIERLIPEAVLSAPNVLE